jgi:hypothetical protein
MLVCELERGGSPSARASYGSIRARYDNFPEYWYRGARIFSGNIAAEYAERCIGLAPEGPFAAECRVILAGALGLAPQDGGSVMARSEIEGIVSRAAAEQRPELLAALMPLLSLPDNSGTFYAVGALRALAASARFRDYFSAEAARGKGRLHERLAYIARSQP